MPACLILGRPCVPCPHCFVSALQRKQPPDPQWKQALGVGVLGVFFSCLSRVHGSRLREPRSSSTCPDADGVTVDEQTACPPAVLSLQQRRVGIDGSGAGEDDDDLSLTRSLADGRPAPPRPVFPSIQDGFSAAAAAAASPRLVPWGSAQLSSSLCPVHLPCCCFTLPSCLKGTTHRLFCRCRCFWRWLKVDAAQEGKWATRNQTGKVGERTGLVGQTLDPPPQYSILLLGLCGVDSWRRRRCLSVFCAVRILLLRVPTAFPKRAG
ncbi:uncharacterized protein J3D65DRAFT_422271 [Phyllosticta citribraziliensis]|uniref:Uncharacterized protein n=1 Tax=Phyllosticta citribraziliensis TaxID=989973 RepID=A0ABR1LHR4_9PEZI